MSRILRNIVIIFVFLLACAGALHAQQLKVVEFQSDMSMTDAVRYPKEDRNGNHCGLIKLGLAWPVSDVVFEGDIIFAEYKEGEWWIYMPRGSNWLTIKSKSSTYLPLRYDFEGIQSSVTYVMTVEKPSGDPGPKVVKEQYLVFQLNPADAILEVNGQFWPVSTQGTVSKFVNFGTYSYRVQAPNYYPMTGTVTVDDPKNKKIVKIDLKPNFGWVEVKGRNYTDAKVYIDNEYVGIVPCKSKALKSGDYVVNIVSELYEPYSERVTVNDNKVTTITPKLIANFAKITLKVDSYAEIWVNDEKKGFGSWTGNMATGTYRIECRLDNHEPTAVTKEITKMMDGQTIILAAPQPVYGSLKVESMPDFAKIFIDGKPMGKTPSFFQQILIGNHEVKLVKEGYFDYTEIVTVCNNESKQISIKMKESDGVKLKLNNELRAKSWQPLVLGDISLAYSFNSSGRGCVFGGSYCSFGEGNIIGWYLDYRMNFFSIKEALTLYAISDIIVMTMEGGGGAAIRLNEGGGKNLVIWTLGPSGGLGFFEYNIIAVR